MLVAFCGYKGAGKDTAAAALPELPLVKFAGALKEMLRAFYVYCGVAHEDIERRLEGDLKEVPCIYLQGKTPRHAMQTLGTEWGREMIGENIWTDAVDHRIDALGGNAKITDLRFPGNEVNLVQKHNGIVIKIVRPSNDNVDVHASEAGVDAIETNHVIINRGTVQDLHRKVREEVYGDE